jgi:hypothetical protein
MARLSAKRAGMRSQTTRDDNKSVVTHFNSDSQGVYPEQSGRVQDDNLPGVILSRVKNLSLCPLEPMHGDKFPKEMNHGR